MVQRPAIAQQKGDAEQILTLLDAAGWSRADVARHYEETEIRSHIRTEGVNPSRIQAIAAAYRKIVARLPEPDPMALTGAAPPGLFISRPAPPLPRQEGVGP
jgi:hypothetical protein